jgi:hypothetical protein
MDTNTHFPFFAGGPNSDRALGASKWCHHSFSSVARYDCCPTSVIRDDPEDPVCVTRIGRVKTAAPDTLRRSDSSSPFEALMQTPHRFRSKRQLWTYSGLGIETHDSAQFRFVRGQLQRSKKPQQLRGLNRNHNHEMKEIFKNTATRASCGRGPFHDFYAALLTKGMKPEMARLTLARKIAAITLTLWKREERFDAEPACSRGAGRSFFS